MRVWDWWADDEGGSSVLDSPLGGEGAWVMARMLARVGACTDEVRLMGIERAEALASLGSASGGWVSVARNVSNARVSPSMERM